jgi:hypothetical protein
MDVRPKQANLMPLAASRSKAPVKSRVPVMNIISERPANPSNEAKDKLILNGKEITSIEKIVFGFKSVSEIQVLDLSMNLIRVIPDCLSSMKLLNKLDLSQNCIDSFGTSLSKLKSLVRLNLAKNKITRIGSSDIYQLFFSKTVIVSHNLITEVTANIRHLVNLRVFYLDGNPFQTLPTTIKELKNLKELKLEWTEYLVPSRLASITSQEFIPKNFEEIELKDDQPNRWMSLEELFAFIADLEIKKSATIFSLNDMQKCFNNGTKANTFEEVSRAIRMNHAGVALSQLEDSSIKLVGLSKLQDLLISSMKCPDKTIAKRLIELGAPCNMRVNKTQETILHLAANCLSDELLFTLRNRINTADMIDEHGNTPLHKLFHKKNERESFFNLDLMNNAKGWGYKMDTNILRSNDENPIGILRDDAHIKAPLTTKEKDTYYSDFYKKMAEVAIQLVDMGVDPNHYNRAGLCAWHLLVMRENYMTFKLMRLCDLSGPKAIDWSLGLHHGELPVLHLTATCNDWRFFVEYLEGKSKVNAIELDSMLRLPDKVISGQKQLLRAKVFLRHLHSDYKLFLKFQPILGDITKTKLKRKASLLRRTNGEDSSISQKSKCSNESLGIRKLNPSNEIKSNLNNFSPIKTDIVTTSDSQSANKVLCMKPKPGFVKLSAPYSVERLGKPSINIGPNLITQQNSKSLQPTDLTGEDNSLSTSKGTNQWLHGAMSNLKVTIKNPRVIMNYDSMKHGILKNYIPQKDPTKKNDSLDIKVDMMNPNPTKVFSRVHNLVPSELSENIQVNKSRQIEVTVNMSQLNSVRSFQSVQRIEGPDIIPKLVKIVTKILLRDLITFRYSFTKLACHVNDENSIDNFSVFQYLMTLKIFISKIGTLMAGMSSYLKPELIPAFHSAIRQELMHDDTLLKIRNLLIEKFSDKKEVILMKKFFKQYALVEEILDRITILFGVELNSSPTIAMKSTLASKSISTRKNGNFIFGSSDLLHRALVVSPQKQLKQMKKTEDNQILLSPDDLRLDGSMDSSGDSLALDMKKLTTPFHVNYRVDISDLKEKFKNQKTQPHQMPLNRFISDHDKGLKCLESKIISFRTNISSTIGTDVNPIQRLEQQTNEPLSKEITNRLVPGYIPNRRIRPKFL